MKTISECFLNIVWTAILTVFCILGFIFDMKAGDYWAAIFCFFASAIGIWYIRSIYKTAKAIEQTMRPRIEVKIIIKDKDDEVETDK